MLLYEVHEHPPHEPHLNPMAQRSLSMVLRMSAPTAPPPGIYVPVPTFFVARSAHKDASEPPLDLETQAQHAIHLAQNGIRGILLLGSSGEAVMISNAERKALIGHMRKAMIDAGFTNYPILAGTATQGIEDTLQQLADSKDAGAQWGMVLAPGYFAGAVSQKGLMAWYTKIADKSPIPILIYHYPAVSNNLALSPATFHALAKHPNIVGCKLSHANLSHHAQIASCPTQPHITPSSFAVFTGLGQQLLGVLAVGGQGAIDGLAAMFPKTMATLYQGYMEGAMDEKDLRELQAQVAEAEELIVRWGTVGVKEGVWRVLGMGSRDGTRLPLEGGLPEGEWEAWAAVFGELGRMEGRLREGKMDGFSG